MGQATARAETGIATPDTMVAAWREGQQATAETQAWALLRAGYPHLPPIPVADTDRIQLYVAISREFETRSDFAMAEQALRRALDIRPQDPAILARLARCLHHLGRVEEAEDVARQAVDRDPEALDGYTGLVWQLLDLGRFEEAVEWAETCRDRLGGSGAALFLLANTLRHIGNDREALKTTEAALKAGLKQPWQALAAIGHIRHDLGHLEQALSAYDSALKAAPGRQDLIHARVNSLMAAGRLKEARALFRMATERLPGYLKNHFDFLPGLPQVPRAPDTAPGKHMVLISAPFTNPCIPLGLGFLKSQTELLTDYRVTLVDANLDWIEDVIGALKEGKTGLTFEDSDIFLEASETFRKGGEEFLDPENHERLAEIFARYRSLVFEALAEQCRRSLQSNGPEPWYITRLARQIVARNPSAIGLSVMFTHQFAGAALLAKAVKRLRPDVLTVFGGGFFNKANLQGLLAHSYVDYVILNEGEGPLPKLLNALDTDGNLEGIDGLAFRDPETGAFDVRENAFNLKHDSLPYADYSDLGLARYFNPEPVIPVISSRGCYWRRCSFCDHFASFAGSYKTQTIPRVVSELEHQMKTTGARLFTFVDEMISAKRFKKICEEILDRGLDLRFYALAKPTANDFTPEILELMYRAGCRAIYWGVESGNVRVLEMMDKGNTVESTSDTLRWAAQAGIRNHLFMIVGFPSETKEELHDSLKFLHGHRDSIDMVLAGHYVMKRGTPVCDQHHNFGVARVLSVRSLCNSRILDYETASGIPAHLTKPWADYLRREFFDLFCPHGRFFGTPRDHIIATYADQDGRGPRPERDLPNPDRLARDLSRLDPADMVDPEVEMFPIWRG